MYIPFEVILKRSRNVRLCSNIGVENFFPGLISLISNRNHLKLFEINEIRTSTSCDGLETAFH